MRARTRTHIHTQCGDKLYVANAGDSRGVLCRGSTAVPLSEDHKPASERERSRIIAAGGFLSEIGGVCRVNGNLNLSRAIGDLKYKSSTELPAKDQVFVLNCLHQRSKRRSNRR
uniref:PPM-type phosphatase domain-containing protein n=1 Tax=Dunaliella tertiolecta TaxID=3047 RepID=A0A7S3QPM9_DUNTE